MIYEGKTAMGEQAPSWELNNAPKTTRSLESKRSPFTMDELFSTYSIEPLSTKAAGAPAQVSLEELQIMYLQEYGKGMNLILETNWYKEEGWNQLLHDNNTFEMFKTMLELFATTKVHDYEAFPRLPQIESRVTWSLMCLPRIAFLKMDSQAPSISGSNNSAGLETLLRRLLVLEYLITNRHLSDNPLSAPYEAPANGPTQQTEFWHQLGQLVTVPLSSTEELWLNLSRLRQLLNGMESRDVLYSIAVARCAPIATVSVSEDGKAVSTVHSDAITIARKFIEDQASRKGTTQAIQRLCGMIVQSWTLFP